MIKNSRTSGGDRTDCPYRSGAFCAALTGHAGRCVCACCVTHRFAQGSVIDGGEWGNVFSVLLDGFIVAAGADGGEGDVFLPMELAGGGNLLTLPEAWFDLPPSRMVYYVIKPCVIARFDAAGIEALRGSAQFAWIVAMALQRKYQETAKTLRETGGKDARRAVKYILDFAERHNIDHMTHAQIALATGLARPTVTKAMHELLTEAEDRGRRE